MFRREVAVTRRHRDCLVAGQLLYLFDWSACHGKPRAKCMPIAVPAWEIASKAYSTWYKRPSGEKIVVHEIVSYICRNKSLEELTRESYLLDIFAMLKCSVIYSIACRIKSVASKFSGCRSNRDSRGKLKVSPVDGEAGAQGKHSTRKCH